MALWTACSRNILICLKLSMEWPKTKTCWVIKNYGFFIWIGLTTSWTNCDVFVVTTIGCLNSIIGTTSLTSSIGLTWMLSITYSKLGSSSFYRLPFVAVAWNSSPPPPPISSEHVHSSSSFEWTTCDLKVVLDLFSRWWGNKFKT